MKTGTVSGGPMYYLSKGLSEKGMAGLGKILAIFFAICCIGGALGGGNMFQAKPVLRAGVGPVSRSSTARVGCSV